jgi:hypothetical protein
VFANWDFHTHSWNAAWIAFYLGPTHIIPRTTLGTSSLLALTYQFSTVNARLPKVRAGCNPHMNQPTGVVLESDGHLDVRLYIHGVQFTHRDGHRWLCHQSVAV